MPDTSTLCPRIFTHISHKILVDTRDTFKYNKRMKRRLSAYGPKG
jgi:hypothetical protein